MMDGHRWIENDLPTRTSHLQTEVDPVPEGNICVQAHVGLERKSNLPTITHASPHHTVDGHGIGEGGRHPHVSHEPPKAGNMPYAPGRGHQNYLSVLHVDASTADRAHSWIFVVTEEAARPSWHRLTVVVEEGDGRPSSDSDAFEHRRHESWLADDAPDDREGKSGNLERCDGLKGGTIRPPGDRDQLEWERLLANQRPRSLPQPHRPLEGRNDDGEAVLGECRSRSGPIPLAGSSPGVQRQVPLLVSTRRRDWR